MQLANSADGTAIAFDQLGAGPPVVVVGGAICDRARTRPLAERMSQQFTVFNYDRRGRGDSADTGPYAVDREIADLAAVIEQAGGTAAVYGYSAGAALLLRASAAGLPISKAVLHDPPFTPDTDDAKSVSQAYAKSLTSLLQADRNGDALALFMGLVGTPPAVVQQMQTQPWWSTAAKLAPTLAYDSAVMDHRSGSSIPVDILSAATIPTIVICGGGNAGWMLGTNQQLAEALPTGSYRELIGQNHEADPDIVVQVVEEFFGNGH